MAMGGAGSPEDEIFEINVTPLVDVCLVLVIIMMVTAPILSEPKLKIELPEAVYADKGEEKAKLNINIDADHHVAINEKEYKWSNLEDELRARIFKAALADKIVIVKGDRESIYGDIIEAMYVARSADARKVTIATKPVNVGKKK